MGIDIYKEISDGVFTKHYQDGVEDGSLPIVTTHDGVLGEFVVLNLFVRADDNTEYFQDIKIEPISLTNPSEIDGTTTGHGVKLIAGETEPTEAEWAAVNYGNTITLSNIGSSLAGDKNTYLPFWYRQECPAGEPADNKENVVLRLSYTAYLV